MEERKELENMKSLKVTRDGAVRKGDDARRAQSSGTESGVEAGPPISIKHMYVHMCRQKQ